jgi:hypothetical protein
MLMNLRKICWGFALGLLAVSPWRLAAQDTVTIPKSRLEELERKEAELDRLKGDLSKAKGEKAQLQKQYEEVAAKVAALPPAAPAPVYVSPPMAALHPLSAGDVVDARDLANHYRADVSAADRRYRKRTFQVRGEIVRFEKPLLTRNYKIVIQSADRQISVMCDFYPPDSYQAVFTVKGGSQLVATLPGQNRVTLASIGDQVVIQGQCRGLGDSAVKLADCELKAAR